MAVFRKYRKFVAKRYRKKPAIKKAVRRAKNTIFKKRVLKVIRSQAETKQAYHTLTPTDFNSAISGSGDALRIIPNISLGSDSNNRVGNIIKPQSLSLRMILQMLPQGNTQSASVCKLAARVMIVTPKMYPTWATASANTGSWMPYLLQKGTTPSGFSGAIDDLYAPVNTNAITTHYNKVFYFNQPWATSSASSIALDQSHLVRFVRKTIKFGSNRSFKYDENVDGGLTPANGNAYVMVVGYAFVDGTSPDTVSTRVRVQYDAILNYEDA